MLKNIEKKDPIILSSFSLLILFTRIPFISKYLYELDSVNYALGLERYDILHHQPHPPGYILYIGLGKIINTLFNEANTTMVVISILFSILTVIFLYYLTKDIFSRKIAIISSILLIFNPIFWFYGEIATIYSIEAFFATLVAYLSYQVFRGRDKFFYLSSLTLGIAGGFRQDLIIFMLPLWFFCLFYNKKSVIRIIKAFSILIFSILLWFIPTIYFTGGYSSYSSASSIINENFQNSSVLFGASALSHLVMLIKLLSWLFLAFGIIGILLLLLYLIINRKNLNFNIFYNTKFIFLLLWILPMLLFQILIHSPKPGYILLYISAISIILAVIINYFSIKIKNKYKYSYETVISSFLVIFILINSFYFIYPSNLSYESTWETPVNIMDHNQEILHIIDTMFIYNYDKIHKNDLNVESHIKRILNISKPQNDIIIIRNTLMDQGFIWKKAVYYLPQYHIYVVEDTENTGVGTSKSNKTFIKYYAKNHQVEIFENKSDIPLNSSSKKIILIMSDKTLFFKDIKRNFDFKSVDLHANMKIYYFELNQNNNINKINIGSHVFIN